MQFGSLGGGPMAPQFQSQTQPGRAISGGGAPPAPQQQPGGGMDPMMLMMLMRMLGSQGGGYQGMPGVEALYGSPGGATPSMTAGGPR